MTHPTPQIRWYRLTPDRVVIALLALEGFLLLSERFEWFDFSRHAIWSVLIAATAIGGAMLLMFFWFLLGLIFKWPFQFSIRVAPADRGCGDPVRVAGAEVAAGEETAGGGGMAYEGRRGLSTIINKPIRFSLRRQATRRQRHGGCASCWETTCSRT